MGLFDSIADVIKAIGTLFARGLPVVAYAETSVGGANNRLFALRASVGPLGDNFLDLDASGGDDVRIRLAPVNLLRPSDGIDLTFTKRSRIQGATIDVFLRTSGDDIRDPTGANIELTRIALRAVDPSRELPGMLQLTLTNATSAAQTTIGVRGTVTAAPANLVNVAPRVLGLGVGTLESREVLKTAEGGMRIYCGERAPPTGVRGLMADVDVTTTPAAEVLGDPLFDVSVVAPPPGPATAPTAAAQGAPGQIGPGRYLYRATWISPGAGAVETAPGPASAPVEVAPGQQAVQITGLAVSATAGARTRLYRTTAADPHHWLRVAELAPGATSYRDVTADAGLGAAMPPSPTTVTYGTAQRSPPPSPLDLRVRVGGFNMGALPDRAELRIARVPNAWQIIALTPPASDVAAIAVSAPGGVGPVEVSATSLVLGVYRSLLGRIVAVPPWLGVTVHAAPAGSAAAQLRCANAPAGSSGLDASRPGDPASIGGVYARLSTAAGPLTASIPQEAVAVEKSETEASACIRGLASVRVAQGEPGVHSAVTGGVIAAIAFGTSGSFGGSDAAPATRTLRLRSTTADTEVTIRAEQVPDRLTVDTDLASAARLEGRLLNVDAASVPRGPTMAQGLGAAVAVGRTPARIDVAVTRGAAGAITAISYDADAFIFDAVLDLRRTPSVAAGMAHVRATADIPRTVNVDLAGRRLSTGGGALTFEVAGRADPTMELPQSTVVNNGARIIVSPPSTASPAPMVGGFGQLDAFLLRLRQLEGAGMGVTLGPATFELEFGPQHDPTGSLSVAVQRRVGPSSLLRLISFVLNENVPRSIAARAFGAQSFGYRLSNAIRASTPGTRVGRFVARLEPTYRELDPASAVDGVTVAGLGSARGDIHILPPRLSARITSLGAEAIWFNQSSGPGWADWERLGNADDRLRMIVLAVNADGRLEAAGTASDDTIWFNRQVSAGGAWGGWQQLGAADDRLRMIVLAVNADGRLEAAGTASDDTIWFNRQVSAGGAWGGWQQLGAADDRLRMIVLAVNADGRLEAAGTASDDTIWFNRQVSAGGAWGGWQQLGAADDRLRMIVLAVNADGRLEAAGTASDDTIWFNRQVSAGGAWGGWQQLGAADDRLRMIVLAVNADGRLEAAGTASDDTIWFNRQVSAGGAWGGWQQLGAADDRLRMIVLAVNADGRLEAAGTASDDTIWFNRQVSAGGSWGAWQMLGNPDDRLRWLVLARAGNGVMQAAGTASGPTTPIRARTGGRMWTMPAGWTAQRIELFTSGALALRDVDAIIYGYDYQGGARWQRIQARRVDYQARLMATTPRLDPIVVWAPSQDPPGENGALGFEIDPNLPLNVYLLNSAAEITRTSSTTPTAPPLSSFDPVLLVEMAQTDAIIFLRPDIVDPGQVLLDTRLGANGTRQYRFVAIRALLGAGAVFLGNTDGDNVFGRDPVSFPPLP